MNNLYDVIIICGGPAGLTAGLYAARAGLETVLFEAGFPGGQASTTDKLHNYPGFPGGIGGPELMANFMKQAEEAGMQTEYAGVSALTLSADKKIIDTEMGGSFEADAVILCMGAKARKLDVPGEEMNIGHGVSYCATCDGMLYRDKNVAVLGFSADAEEEAEFLRSIGCNLRFFSAEESKKARILGENRVEGVEIGGEIIPFDGVFVLRDTVAPQALLPGLELQGVHIAVQTDMRTSVSGVFAAGDCVGTPYQIAKAVGEGNIAALSAAKYLDQKAKEKIN